MDSSPAQKLATIEQPSHLLDSLDGPFVHARPNDAAIIKGQGEAHFTP